MIVQELAQGFPVARPSLLFVEEINHRVVNQYAEAIASLHLASIACASPTAKQALATAADRLRAHAETYRALLPPHGDEPIDLGDFISTLCASLSKSSLADKRVRIAVKTEEITLSGDKCWRIGLIVAELVRNAARHGLSGREGAIEVRLIERSGWVSCAVRDDGRAAENAEPGRGLHLVQSIAAELEGFVVGRFTPKGSLVRVRLPRGTVAGSASRSRRPLAPPSPASTYQLVKCAPRSTMGST